MSNIKFKIAAKTDVGRVRTNNEDNLQAASDLTTAPMKWVNDQECDLGDKGALLVVADGMGGMNAGEVASEIAINTIREFFSPDNITEKVMSSRVEIDTFMKKSIKEADKRIKDTARKNPTNRGMGTTIVVAWILNDKLYVAWCGDSRAYIYNRINGLRQLSKDHSYVQTLVDSGRISRDDAFDYPDSNIITRCLCDSDQSARPDSLSTPVTLCNGDIVLLCSDGLSGMIRDHEIEMVMTENSNNLSVCTDMLIEAACEASGQDNITVALCKILSGGSEASRNLKGNAMSNTISLASNHLRLIDYRKYFRIIVWMLFFVGIFVAGYFCGYNRMFLGEHLMGANGHENDSIIHDTLTNVISDQNKSKETKKDSVTTDPAISRKLKDMTVSLPDTIVVVSDVADISKLSEKINRPFAGFNVKCNGKQIVKNGKILNTAEKIHVGDTLKFEKRI